MQAFTPNLSTIYGDYIISVAAQRGQDGLFGATVRISVNESGDPPRALFLLPSIFVSDREASTNGILQATYWSDLQRLPADQPIHLLPNLREVEYTRIRGLMADGLTLPARFEEWTAQIDQRERSAQAIAHYPMRVLVIAHDLMAYCERNRRRFDLDAMQAYLDEAARAQFLWLGSRHRASTGA